MGEIGKILVNFRGSGAGAGAKKYDFSPFFIKEFMGGLSKISMVHV